MGELKNTMVNHVRSAQKWLNRAETAFENEKDTRGKLDLMLAQAEMQHLHESAVKGKKFSLIKQAIAFSFAAVLFSSGIGGAYFYFHHTGLQPASHIQLADRPLSPNSIPRTSLEPMLSSPPTGSGVIAGTTVPAAAVQSVPQQLTTVPTQKDDNARMAVNQATVDRDTASVQVVRPDEMQKLIRAAGKSLRGQ